MLTVVSLLFLLTQANDGYLSVLSDVEGLSVYVDSDSIGVTPIGKHTLTPGTYTVSFFAEDSFEAVYNQIKHGSVKKKLSSLWQLSRYGAGTQRVRIVSDALNEVYINKEKVDKAAGKTKRRFYLGVGGVFATGLLSGVLLAQAF
jgi:hypothetical protein